MSSSFLDAATKAYNNGDYKQCIEIVTQSLNSNIEDNSARILLLRSKVYKNSLEFELALQDAQDALQFLKSNYLESDAIFQTQHKECYALIHQNELEIAREKAEEPIRLMYENVLNELQQEDSFDKIRELVVLYGIPNETRHERANFINKSGKSSLRSKIWKILLRVKYLDVDYYLKLVKTSEHLNMQKALNDTFRTMNNVKDLVSRVPLKKLERTLKCVTSHIERKYEQTLTAFLSVLLYTMDEVSAFNCFCRWQNQYTLSVFEASTIQANLVVEVLEHVDPTLSAELQVHNPTQKRLCAVQIFSFTTSWFFDCYSKSKADDLHDLLKVWDYLFALGPSFIVYFVAAHLVLNRKVLLQDKVFGIQNLLKTNATVSHSIPLALRFVREVPVSLYNKIIASVSDAQLVAQYVPPQK